VSTIFSYRDYDRSTDFNFILNSWLKSYKDSDACRNIDSKVYYKQYAIIIQSLLESQNTTIIADSTNPSIIYGYINYLNPNHINFVYIKFALRRNQLAKQLLQAINTDLTDTITITHYSYILDSLKNKYQLSYNPFGDI